MVEQRWKCSPIIRQIRIGVLQNVQNSTCRVAGSLRRPRSCLLTPKGEIGVRVFGGLNPGSARFVGNAGTGVRF